MLTVHHLENSRSHRILWLLEELEVDYEIARYERDPDTMLAPDELRDVHPLGKSPVVTTDDGRTMAESGAIIEFLLDEYGDDKLRPERGTPEFDRYRYWMHYAEGSAMMPLFLELVFNRLPTEAPWPLRPVVKLVSNGVMQELVEPRIDNHMRFWDDELAERPYFAGEAFTAADIQMSFILEMATLHGRNGFQNVNRLVERLRERPAYQRAEERGGGLSAFIDT